MAKYREHLPQLGNDVFLSDSGMETTLIFRDGYDLPAFAAFVLLDTVGFSLVASVALTVVLNLVLFLFPGAARRLHDALVRHAEHSAHDPTDESEPPRVRVIFPWKAMLIGSLVLTIVINLLIAILR